MATKTRFNAVERTLYGMLTENTGQSLLDSGSAYGRMWEKNNRLTIKDFYNAPEVVYEDGFYTISFFHNFRRSVSVTRLCSYFNSTFVKDENVNYLGYSPRAERWLLKKGFVFEGHHNCYNWDSRMSQLYQFTDLTKDGKDYILLQSHQGCDVRGGYSNARLFLNSGDFMCEKVYGTVVREDGTTIYVDNYYRESFLTESEKSEEIDIGPKDRVSLYLS